MKNKKLLYILVPVVLLVWGLIIYRVVSHYSGSQEEDVPVENNKASFVLQENKDTFEIVANYRDPFLGKARITYEPGNVSVVSNVSKVTNREKTNPKKEEPRGKTVVWPMLNYGGLVVNNKSNDITGLLTVDKSNHLVMKGNVVKEIQVLDIFPDSIIVSKESVVKTIIRKKK